MTDLVARAHFIPKLHGFFDRQYRHYVLYGGRGSGKSWAVAQELVLMALEGKEIILCCREFQTSIRQSVKKLIQDTIERLGVRQFFKWNDREIVCTATGTLFLFAGLWNNYENIKSTEGVTVAWVEEAQTVSEQSIDVLIPTILRNPNPMLVYTMNPRLPTDYTYTQYVEPSDVPRNVKRIKINWRENPWFSEAMHEEMELMKEINYSKYLHIWEGELMVDDEALVFRGNVISEAFDTPDDAEFMLGMDFGFSNDPLAITRSFMPKDRELRIDYEAGGKDVMIDEHYKCLEEIPKSKKYPIIADSARPETIAHIRRRDGYHIKGAQKGPGSVEDGISWLQSQRINIHPRCAETLIEFRTHKFKRHSQTNEITRIPEDKDNHYIDATRYAWEHKWLRSRLMIDA